MTDTTRIPDEPSNEPTAVLEPQTPASPTAPVREKASRKRTLLIAGGAVLAAVVLAGGGAAIGAAVADDDDDDDRVAAGALDRDSEREAGARSGGAGSDGGQPSLPADLGATSADELTTIVAAAAAQAEGVAVSIDARRDGSWEVQFEAEDGAETEVRVAEDGTASVVSTDAAEAGDTAPEGALDAVTIDAIVTAALAEAEGRIVDVDLDTDADTRSPYDVSVLTADRGVIDIELDAAFAVVGTDIDD